ncbi:MAG TPA: class I SAM-dependent methyltransferase [Actinocatenispora sp.]
MNDAPRQIPARVLAARRVADRVGFAENCDDRTGALLRTLASGKPGGTLLELGTGVGVGTAWLLDGMDDRARLTTIEGRADRSALAREAIGDDPRVSFVTTPVGPWLGDYHGPALDLVFVDTYRGKYVERGQLLDRLAPGGFYVGDDLLPQPTWAPDQASYVDAFLDEVTRDPTLSVTVLDWSSGLLLATRRT